MHGESLGLSYDELTNISTAQNVNIARNGMQMTVMVVKSFSAIIIFHFKVKTSVKCSNSFSSTDIAESSSLSAGTSILQWATAKKQMKLMISCSTSRVSEPSPFHFPSSMSPLWAREPRGRDPSPQHTLVLAALGAHRVQLSSLESRVWLQSWNIEPSGQAQNDHFPGHPLPYPPLQICVCWNLG